MNDSNSTTQPEIKARRLEMFIYQTIAIAAFATALTSAYYIGKSQGKTDFTIDIYPEDQGGDVRRLTSIDTSLHV